MLSLNKTIVAPVVLLALLIYTNPTIEAYEKFIHQQIIEETRTQDDVTKIFGSLFGGIASSLIVNSTIRKDFIIFSYYDTDLGDEQLIVIGILNNFIIINSYKLEQKNISNQYSIEKEISLVQSKEVSLARSSDTDKAISCIQVPSTTKQDFKNEDLSNLAEWAKRYPTHSFGDREKINFFELPQIRKRLQHILSSTDFKAVTIEYEVESPIELIDNYLFVYRCKPHDCINENASIAVGLSNGSILVALTTSSDIATNSSIRHCFALNSSLTKLPDNILKRFFLSLIQEHSEL